MSSKNSTKKIKICHVTSVHNRHDVRIFHKECKSLANNGYNVILLVNDNFPDENIDGVRIISTKLKPRNRFERMIKSKRILKKKMIDVDAEIYHFHDPELLPEAIWIKLLGKKAIFDFHEDVSKQILYKYWIPKPLRSLISYLYKKYEENRAKKCDALISVTPKFVDRLKLINHKTTLVTNYPIVNPDDKIIDFNKSKSICFAGGISPQWNHENIIKAIESIDGIEYILAGTDYQGYIEDLKKLDGWNKVRFLGRIPHNDVKEIYNEAMIGMTLLSYNTQVGNEGTLGNTKMFEFMAAGLPVICSNSRLWKEIIEKYECGITVNPDDIVEIIDAINFICSNPEAARKMGENGRKAILEEYSWVSQEKNLLDLYAQISAND